MEFTAAGVGHLRTSQESFKQFLMFKTSVFGAQSQEMKHCSGILTSIHEL